MRTWALPALAFLQCIPAASGTAPEEPGTGTCPVGGCKSTGVQADYLYPYGRGHPHHFGQSPYTFGGKACNLTASLKWSWTHPVNKHLHVMTGKPLVDDQANLYVSSTGAIYKFTLEGQMLWSWELDNESGARNLPNNPAIMDGLLYSCITTGEVFALDMHSGQLRWSVKAAESIGGDTAFIVAKDGMVFLDVDEPLPMSGRMNRVVALNGSSGEQIWEFSPDTGVWNFLPLFPGDGTMLFQTWSGAAFRLNQSNGKLIWRAGKPPSDSLLWTDGGPALGPQGIFYTVSSTGDQSFAPASFGGGLHAFRVEDGELLWEVTNFDQGIYSWPMVGKLGPGDELSVVVLVGSLGGLPLIAYLGMFPKWSPLIGSLGGLLVHLIATRRRCRKRCCLLQRKSFKGKVCQAVLLVLLGVVLQFLLVVLLISLRLPPHFHAHVQAFDAKTGTPQWRVDLPEYWWWSGRADAEKMHFLYSQPRSLRELCLPPATGYPAMDAQGLFYIGYLDGMFYRLKDWNGDGKIEGESEMCTFDAEASFPTGGPTIIPGALLTINCNSLYVFQQE